MFEKLVEYFLNKPTRLIELGRSFSVMGIILFITGMLGRVGTTTIAIFGGRGNAESGKTLAEIYPTLPTWWIPETIVGGLFSVVLFFVGVWLIFLGKKFKHFIDD